MKTRTKLLLAAATLVALAVWGFLWLGAHIDSYDRRFQDCMTAKQAQSHHYFGEDAYDQAMAECERQAGAPPTQTGNPDTWKAP